MAEYICQHAATCRAGYVCDHAEPHGHIPECDEGCNHYRGTPGAHCEPCPKPDLTGIVQCEVFEGNPQEAKRQFNAWAVEHENISLEGKMALAYAGAIVIIAFFKELREV
jgi:hypothetical protein